MPYIISEETRRKLRESHLGKPGNGIGKKRPSMTGNNHPMWIDGRSKDKAYLRIRDKKYQSEDPDRYKAYHREYHARRRTALGSHTKKQFLELKLQYKLTCPVCLRKEPEIKLQEDHIKPLFLGGSNDIENIQPLCGSCNSKKALSIKKYAPIV